VPQSRGRCEQEPPRSPAGPPRGCVVLLQPLRESRILIATKQFDAKIKDLLTADELAELEFALASDPAAHPIIPRTGGVRKMRWSRSGSGKRGGIRVIYYYSAYHGVALMMAAYAKNVQEDLTDDQKRKIRGVATEFKESLGP
jgi:hypothetical protein